MQRLDAECSKGPVSSYSMNPSIGIAEGIHQAVFACWLLQLYSRIHILLGTANMQCEGWLERCLKAWHEPPLQA